VLTNKTHSSNDATECVTLTALPMGTATDTAQNLIKDFKHKL